MSKEKKLISYSPRDLHRVRGAISIIQAERKEILTIEKCRNVSAQIALARVYIYLDIFFLSAID